MTDKEKALMEAVCNKTNEVLKENLSVEDIKAKVRVTIECNCGDDGNEDCIIHNPDHPLQPMQILITKVAEIEKERDHWKANHDEQVKQKQQWKEYIQGTERYAQIKKGYEALENRIIELEGLVYVPGLLKCAKCDFRLISSTLNVTTGQIKANDNPEKCPNGCGPLWRVSERQAGNECIDRMEVFQARVTELEQTILKETAVIEVLPDTEKMFYALKRLRNLVNEHKEKEITPCP